jgi:PAS domain S-box-containing protein
VVDRRKDGSEFPVFLSTSKLKDSSGRTIGLMGVAQDITERKRAEEQIRLLADAVHSANEMISITDEQNRITFVNQAFLNAYGYSEAEILGRKPEFLYSSRNPPGLCDRVFAETLNGFWSGEILNCRKDRSEFPIALSTSPIRTASGVLLGLVGVARDITERKRAEKQTTAFSWLGYRLSAATTPLQAAEIIMRVASELFGWDAGYFHLYDQAIDELVPVLTLDTVDGECVPVSSATFTRDPSPLMREVMQQGARLVNRPTESAPLHQLVPFGNTARRSESMMYVPIHSSGTVLGILSIQSYLPRAYSEADLMLLQALADQCGGALQRLRVTEALRESELRFRALFESAPIGIALHDLAGGFVHVNAAYQSMVGYSREELRQVNVSQITHPEDVAEALSLFDGLRDGKSEGYHREKRYLRKDGAVVWAQTSASAIRNTEGGLVYIISMVEDITERKKVVRALEESERKLRLIAENTRDVIFAFDLERRPAYVNPAVAELTGYTFAELQQRSFLDWVHPEDRQRMEQQWADLYAGESQSEVEFRVVTREGEAKWCSSSWGPLLDEAGRQIGVQGHVRDVSERKQLEREVVESTANERRRIGHELHDGLGQYLAGIAFRAKAFEQSLGAVGAPFNSEAHELVSLISNAISQSRSLARGLDPVDVETIGLPAALQNLATETRKFFDVGCQFKCPDTRLALDSPTALSLYRIVQEAIHNAIRHGEARQIEIGLETAAGQLALRVQDDGVGFEVGSAPESGMGLRVMQYRARSIGGSLKILSQRSQGTQICCEVPLRGERL